MIGIRERRHGSWLDRNSAAVLGCLMGHRLVQRCEGEPGVFVTLTYDRSNYADALDLYRSQSEEQHVAIFIRRLSRLLGRSLKGQWTRKLEFQEGGWVHWHLVILGQKFIPNGMIEQAWGRGFTKTKGLTKQRLRYMCKYVCKGNVSMPAFILGERPKSVKVFASSPGFWKDVVPPKESSYCPIYAKYGPIPAPKLPAYVPIGERMKQNRGCTIAKGRPGSNPYGVYSVKCEPVRLMSLVAEHSGKCEQGQGWLWFDVEEDLVERLVAKACGEHRSRSEATERSRTPQACGLNLRGTRKPDSVVPLPSWLHDWWREQASDAWLN